MALSAGACLGPYEILSALGAGGMGEVYRARDMKLGRDVALKVLPDSLAHDPERLARFEREAHLLATLNHPHIAHIHGFEDSTGVPALVMELVEGPTLADRIGKGPIPIEDALPIAKQIAEALEAAHEQGIIHRDLKPTNIKVRNDGSVKVLDFGLAKLQAERSETADGAVQAPDLTHSPTIGYGATQAGVMLGTVAYMSPEQARGRTVDKRTDIWAFGCVLHEMLTGAPAFIGDTVTDVIAAVVKNEPDGSKLPTGTPAAIRLLLRRCLQKDLGRRLQHVGDARIEIEEAITEPVRQPTAAAARAPRRQLRFAVPWAAAIITTAALLVSQLGRSRSGNHVPAVARVELNMPPDVQVGAVIAPAAWLSPDGSRVAFSGATAGIRRIYVRRLDEFVPTPVRGTETGSTFCFSPDGDAIAFVPTSRELKKVSLADGQLTTLAPDVDYNAGVAWGSDDRITFGRNGALWQVAAAGGAPPQQLTRLDSSKNEYWHGMPSAVPGQAILFASVTGSDRPAVNIDAISAPGGQRHRVVESGTYPLYASGHLLFFRDGALLATRFDPDKLEMTGHAVSALDNVSLDANGFPLVTLASNGSLAYVPSGNATRRLVWVSRQGVEQEITDIPRPYANPRLASDGHRIVVEIAGGDLWIQDAARGTFIRLTSGETLGNSWAVWTRDARRVVFRTLTGLRWIDADGGDRSTVISNTTVNDIPTSISPDSRTLAFIRQAPDTKGDVYVLSLDGDPNPRPIVKTQGYDGGAQFSPDGHWMAYVSNESGPFEVYVRPYPGPDRKLQVSIRGGTHPKWNPNGKELFYRTGNKMMVVEVSTRSGDIALSQPRVLFEQRFAFGAAMSIANYDVSPDGQRFVMVKDDSSSGRLNIVLNWFEELRRLVPMK
jgi:Tol biopolymer transport system component